MIDGYQIKCLSGSGVETVETVYTVYICLLIVAAKRDQEAILFGNQQNDPRLKKKKSDPAVPVIADDSSLDKQGSVIAVPAKQEDFIPEEHQVAGSAQEQTAVEADDNQEQEQVAPVVPAITQQLPEGPVGDAGSEVDADSVEEELKDILADSSEGEGPVETVGAPVEEPNDDVPAEEEEVESEEEGEGAEQTDDSEGAAVVQADNDVNTPLLDLYYYMRENGKTAGEGRQKYIVDIIISNVVFVVIPHLSRYQYLLKSQMRKFTLHNTFALSSEV